MPWSHLIGHPNYPEVGIFEGGHYFDKGVWHSEKATIMAGAGGSFNAFCRELLYKRLLNLAGEEYSFEKFIAFDSEKKAKKNE